MDTLAIALYRQRREERLAARGIRVKKRQYRKSKDLKKLDKQPPVPTFRKDADGDDDQQNEQKRGGGGGHGNTKLPFGLCQKYGIEIGDGWTPKDAWDALAGKGVTPGEIYRKLRAGEEIGPDIKTEPPKKDPVKTIDGSGGKYYLKDLKARQTWGYRGERPWALEGTPEWHDDVPEDERHGYRSTWLGRFATLTDMYHFLKRKGVEEFMDPETGELVNPVEMELPTMLYSDGERGYSAMAIGMKKDLYAITGTDFMGKKRAVKEFRSLEDAKQWLERHGISEDDVKLSPALKKRETERLSWLTSDKKEYMEVDGVRYGDLRMQKERYGGWYELFGEDEDGRQKKLSFSSKTELLKYLKDQGVEKVRDQDKSIVNPTELDIPDALVKIDNTSYQSFEYQLRGGDLILYGKDLDGETHSIDYMRKYETFEAFRERMAEKGIESDDWISEDDDVKEHIKRVRKEQEDQERRRKEFPSKAVPVLGGMYMEPKLVWNGPGSSLELRGYDSYGRDYCIATQSNMADMIDLMEKNGLNPDDLIKDHELRAEYDRIDKIRKDFDATAEDFGYGKYADISVSVDSLGEYRLVGYERSGKLRRLTYGGDMYSLTDQMEKGGITDIDKYIKDDKIRQEYETFKKRIAEFEQKAIDIDGYRLSDVEVVAADDPGKFKVIGYDKKGSRKTMSMSTDMYSTVRYAKSRGLNVEDFIKQPEVKQAYQEYKKIQEKFDSEAKDFGGEKYLDLKMEYDSDGWYRLKGTDIRGRRITLVESTSSYSMDEKLKTSGMSSDLTIDSFDPSDSMKERKKVLQKAKDAVASGEYYDMGIDGQAFKSIHADKIGDKWSIKGVDIDGKEKQITETADWDETVDTLEKFNVKDYKLLTKDGTYGRPADGMRHVMLLRGTDGSFRVYADSASKGTHAEVYSTTTEEAAKQWLRDNNVDTGSIKTRGMNPNDDAPRSHTQPSLSKFDVYRMDRISKSFVDDMTADEKNEIAEMLTTVFQKGAYRVARSTSSFGAIIENGYKSQVETGKGGSGAAQDKELRKKASKIFYGHEGLDDKDYEKCGYIGFADEAEDWDDSAHPGYGGRSPLTYTLRKDTMKDRTTYTYGDSLNTRRWMACAGYAGDKPTIEGMSALDSEYYVKNALESYRRYKNGDISYKEMFDDIRRYANNGYIELQFHGPVTVADIEKVSFNSKKDLEAAFNKMSDTRRKKVIGLLRQNGVQLIYRENRRSEFQDAWEWIKDQYPGDFSAEV